MTDQQEHLEAVALLEALKFVNELRIPVMSRDTSISLVERGRLTRKLFKDLGLKGITARKLTGRNLYAVMIGLPNWLDGNGKNMREYQQKVSLAIEEILMRAFPREIDKSDPSTDYIDSPWWILFQRPTRRD